MLADRVLKRMFWIAPAALVAAAAMLNAQAVSSLIGIELQTAAGKLAQAPIPARVVLPPKATRTTSASAILARNPFDHVTGSLVAAPTEATSSSTAARELDTSDPWSAPPCDGVDVNAIAASSDDEWSFASISGADKKSHLLRRGGKIGSQEVYFIGWDRLWLASEGVLCQAKVFGAVQAPPPPPAPASAPPPRRGVKALDPALRKGIQAVSATEFDIDRSVVDRILENQSELMRQARIIPVTENGRVVGVRLLGVRPDTLLGVLGMQNNDRLETINGFEVANPEKALEAYARLRTADKLTIKVNRAGKTVNLDYNIK